MARGPAGRVSTRRGHHLRVAPSGRPRARGGHLSFQRRGRNKGASTIPVEMHGKGRASDPAERHNVRKIKRFWCWRSISKECLRKTLVFPLQHRLRALRRRSPPDWRGSAFSPVPPERPLKSDRETLKVTAAPELGSRKALNLRSEVGWSVATNGLFLTVHFSTNLARTLR